MVEIIAIYLTAWCPSCKRLTKFLKKHKIYFTAIDIDKDQNASEIVIELNNGKRCVPTVAFSDNTFITNPDSTQIIDKLDLKLQDL